jgi:hypothetical protein
VAAKPFPAPPPLFLLPFNDAELATKAFPPAEDNGEGEHSERWHDDDPSDLSASDTGAHFTQPRSQSRGLALPLATELDNFTTTSPLDRAAIPPAAFIQHLLLNQNFQNLPNLQETSKNSF